MAENLLCCPVQNLKIEIDSDRIRKVYYRIREKLDNNELKVEFEPVYQAYRASIGKYGAMTVDKSKKYVSACDFYVWSGLFLEYLLPQQLKSFATKSIEAKLNFVGFSFFEHYGELIKHYDGIPEYTWNAQPFDNESKKICNLNLIITSTDPKAYSYAIDKVTGHKETYKSIPGTINLIDASVDHGVINVGFREVFQMRWLSPVSEVKSFLDANNFL